MADDRLFKKGTIRLKSLDELDLVEESFKDKGCVSPGGAAGILKVSRAYIHQLEKDKRIRAYRIKEEKVDTSGLPFIYKILFLASKREDYIFIPVVDLEEYQAEMREKRKK